MIDNIITLLVLVLIICCTLIFIAFILFTALKTNKTNNNHQKEPCTQSKSNVLSTKKMGNITPVEKLQELEELEELEEFGICAPSEYGSSESWRCKIFKNCHDCLIDYVNQRAEEYSSYSHFLKISKQKEEPP